MKTHLSLDECKFLINGAPTYSGKSYRGKSIEGLLLNSRMVQAIFDDSSLETVELWKYPDTGIWDPDRNTDEFCAMLSQYRAYGLLAVTVGMQGGGAVYEDEVMKAFDNSGFFKSGDLKPAYLDRLKRVLQAADDCGMVVIVSAYYWAHTNKVSPAAFETGITNLARWILENGYRNVILEVANEIRNDWPAPFLPENIHELIAAVQSVEVQGDRLLVGCSAFPDDALQRESWLAQEDITFVHGNDQTPERLAKRIQEIRETEAYQNRKRPIVINEDSIFLDNFEEALKQGVSWGFYHQGFGSRYQDKRFSWKSFGREKETERLSGFQTPPINWGINDCAKMQFFNKVAEVTGHHDARLME